MLHTTLHLFSHIYQSCISIRHLPRYTAIHTFLPAKDGKSAAVESLTVDKYQGRDKPVIIVSFVRSNTTGKWMGYSAIRMQS